ncbi:39S ribosomal protein L46, mitochondrial [Elysia marginata]|uniref:39S ribosomal protein L46, mitochondrial n=1 Tax=Elysia marginata TaxID=1093978 RepID=A0AAV4EZY5_9GAST|nr:39S ribosomal protein L46, mitochondrial [Elysia marginata]
MRCVQLCSHVKILKKQILNPSFYTNQVRHGSILYSAICVERHPVITPDKSRIEEHFSEILSKIEEENSYLSDHEVRHLKELQAAKMKQESADEETANAEAADAETITALDLEDKWDAEVKSFTPASRITQADDSGDQQSLDRKLDSSLYLLVKQNIAGREHWVLPQATWEEGETLRQTAERALSSVCGDVRANVLGNAPCAVAKYEPPTDAEEQPIKINMKTGQDVINLINDIACSPNLLCNATVVKVVLDTTKAKTRNSKQKFPYTAIAQNLIDSHSLNDNISLSLLRRKIQTVYQEQYSKLIKNITRNWIEIDFFVRQDFKLPLETSATANEFIPGKPESEQQSNSSPERPASSSTCTVVTPVKTRTDCEKCPTAKKLTFSFKKTLQNEKKKLTRYKHLSANFKQVYKVRETRQKVKRHEEKLESLKLEVRNKEIKIKYLQSKLTTAVNRNNDLLKEIGNLQSENARLQKDLVGSKTECKGLKKEVKASHSNLLVIDQLRSEIEEYQTQSTNKSDVFISMKGKTYSPVIRRCIYQQLLCDVPITNCGTLLWNFVTTVLQKKIDRVPCATTCSQMAYELGVLSTLQLTEFMLSQQYLCLSWDATSLEGEHVNEIHVTANKTECLILDIKHLPGGKSSDYVTHVMSAMTEAAASYARYSGSRQEEVYHAIKSSISATLTDRAAVNACVTRQLRDELESELIQLNCNVHPLDSVAREVRRMLSQLDKEHGITGHCYGTDGTAANLINAVSVLRFKDGTGDPLGFKNLLRQHDLPMGTFVRYVGNRLHIMFHLAGILMTHHAMLLAFTEDQCTAGGLLRSSIMKDLKNEKIMVQVWALGVCGKVFSGPWMTRFYSSQMSNLEMGPHVQQCVKNMETWLENPNLLLQPTEDAFGTTLNPEQDSVWGALLEYGEQNEEFQVVCLKEVLRGALTVLNRQLNDFISGAFADPSADMREKTAGAPSHNMSSERNLGCYDRLWRRAPNATVGFLTGKVKCKMNRTLEWLNSKTPIEQEKLIEFVVNEAREERVRAFAEQKSLCGAISQRKQEVALLRKKSKRNSLIRQINKAIKEKDVCELPCSDSLKDRLKKYFEDPTSVVGMLVVHTVDITDWYARVLKSLPGKFEFSYWSMNETESSAVDFIRPVNDFFADAVQGDVAFL